MILNNTSVQLAWAISLSDNKEVAITELNKTQNGLKCNCVCPYCGQKLLAKMGTERKWHFAHQEETDCDVIKINETMLHKRAKELFLKNDAICLPEFALDGMADKNCNEYDKRQCEKYVHRAKGYFKYSECDLEVKKDGFTPDVVIRNIDGEELCIEILVSHKVGNHKRDLIAATNLSCIEIDVSKFCDNKFNENKFNNDNKFNIERPRKKYALITVAMGEGLIKSFYEMGADIVIDGGQTKNPSVEEFVKAFEKVNADEIFILPNNSNIILAAKEAIDVFYEKLKNDLLDKSVIHLIETKNMGQAYSILSMLDYSEDDGKKIADNMRQDMEGIITAQITTSIRDVNINNVEVKCGDYIGFTDKEIKASGKNRLDVCEKLLKSLHLEEKTFIVVVYGKNIAEEEKYKTQEMIKNKYEDIELYEMDGEQDIYDYILIMQ